MVKTENKQHIWNVFSSPTKKAFFSPDDFGEEEQLIAKTAEQFVQKEIIPQIESIEQHDYAMTRRLFEQLGEVGLLGVEVAEEYGGFALGKKVSGLIAEKMGYGGSFSVSFNIHVGVGTLPYVYFGTEQQKQTYLPKLVSGEWIGGYALTEPNAGSDALQAKTSATLTKDRSSWVLNGEKQWITNARIADVFVVFAKTAEGMTAFIVERGYQGVSIGPEEKKMGIKGSSTATLILEDATIPVENVLGQVGKGHLVALNILNLARLKLAFANIGTSKQAIELSVNYSKERKQFGQPIQQFSMIQEKLADMAINVYGAESAAYRTAGLIDEEEAEADYIAKFAMECAINKVQSSETLGRIVDEAVQIHGGYGYMQEYDVERLYRDARISRIFEGTNEINRLTIAKALLGNYPSIKLTEKTNQRNEQFIHSAKQLLLLGLKAFSDCGIQREEQEYLRLLADSMIDIYVMESAFLRTENSLAKQKDCQQLMTHMLCEEGYRRVKSNILSSLASLDVNETVKQALLNDARAIDVPMYYNSILTKRRIAQYVINSGKYPS